MAPYGTFTPQFKLNNLPELSGQSIINSTSTNMLEIMPSQNKLSTVQVAPAQILEDGTLLVLAESSCSLSKIKTSTETFVKKKNFWGHVMTNEDICDLYRKITPYNSFRHNPNINNNPTEYKFLIQP